MLTHVAVYRRCTSAARAEIPLKDQHINQNMDLTGPELDFVHLAAGMGVQGTRVEKADAIATALADAVAANRPYLVEIAVEGKR
jgi:benzoylformate decarboxylase